MKIGIVTKNKIFDVIVINTTLDRATTTCCR